MLWDLQCGLRCAVNPQWGMPSGATRQKARHPSLAGANERFCARLLHVLLASKLVWEEIGGVVERAVWLVPPTWW